VLFVHVARHATDGATLTSGIAALEDHNHLATGAFEV